MSNFNQDLDAESKVHQFIRKYGYSIFEQNNFDYTEYHYSDANISEKKQNAGIDVELTRHSNVEPELDVSIKYSIDEKAAVTACNTGLPTFCQELSFVLNGNQKTGWFLKEKENTHYLFCYIALTEKGFKKYNQHFNVFQKWQDINWENDIQEIEIILVSKRKLRSFYNKEIKHLIKQLNEQNNKFFDDIEYKGLGKKIIRQNSNVLQNIDSKNNAILKVYFDNFKQKAYTKKENRIRYTDGRFDYVKTFSLSEQPVNLIIRKSDLLRIAGYDCNNPNKKYGHYFITKEYGLQRQPTFWNFSRGKWLNKANYSEF